MRTKVSIKKRVLVGVLITAVCAVTTGCHLKHEWQEATCTTPRTCTVCGETEGEALGHTWLEADCITPKTCSVCGETEGEALGHTWLEADCTTKKTCSICGETEGEALGHTWQDADYWAPRTCTACGETEGEILTPAFEEHNLQPNIKVDETHDYVTVCYENPDAKTTGKLTLSDYKVFESDDTHEKLDGYEWHTVHAHILFDDENAWEYGMSIGNCYENYYDIEGWDQGVRVEEEERLYTVRYMGTEYDKCLANRVNGGFGDWVGQSIEWDADYEARLPKGYDGFVLGFRDNSIVWEEGQHIYDIADENTLFFRMQ